MGDAFVLGLIVVCAILGCVIVDLAERRHPKVGISKIQIGEVFLTGKALEYVILRMRNRILELTDENERLRREVRLEKTVRIQ